MGGGDRGAGAREIRVRGGGGERAGSGSSKKAEIIYQAFNTFKNENPQCFEF